MSPHRAKSGCLHWPGRVVSPADWPRRPPAGAGDILHAPDHVAALPSRPRARRRRLLVQMSRRRRRRPAPPRPWRHDIRRARASLHPSVIYALFTFGFVGGLLHFPGVVSRGALAIAMVSAWRRAGASATLFQALGDAGASGAAASTRRGAAGAGPRALRARAAGQGPRRAQGPRGGHAGHHRRGAIAEGAEVVIVEVRDGVAHVATAESGKGGVMETGIDVGGVDLGTAISLLAGAVAVVFAMTIILAVIKSFLYICRPNEILIFAGPRATRCPTAARSATRWCGTAGRCAPRSWRRCRAWTCG